MTGNQTTRQREFSATLTSVYRRAGYTVGRGNISGQEHARVIVPLVVTYTTTNPTSNRQPITA